MITTRRQFLVGGLQVAAAVPLGARLFAAAAPDDPADERVLVVLQLSGGNDGLNTVVPHRQDAYYRARPTLGLARGSLHPLDGDHGLHPQLRPLGELFDEGRVAVVHGVGYPEPDRSHFRSMEIWHTADPIDPPGETGWLGRLADQIALRHPASMAALHVGASDLPLALRGREYFAPTVRDARGFRLQPMPAAFDRGRAALLAGDAAGNLAFLREAARTTYRAAERMAELADAGSAASYPGHGLAQRLRLVARLITGGFGTRIFQVEHNGFDTHSAQKNSHSALLGELSTGLRAFQRDLESHQLSDRVVVLVFSEFGRRVEENGSKGTDHGAGAPAFLIGGAVRGGLHGTGPDLGHLERGDIPFTTDFRSIYTELARDWMGLEPPTEHGASRLLIG